MKSRFINLMIMASAFLITACHPLKDESIRGELKLNPRWGGGINLYDEDSKSVVTLKPGQYLLEFPTIYLPFQDAKIRISNAQGQRVLTMAVPRNRIRKDGTFELYMGDSKSTLQFNILGGRRDVILSKKRYSAIREYCTYQESYPCTTTCTDSNGNVTSCMSTCTRTVPGDYDVAYEYRKVKSLYRILFDGSDMINAGQFVGESPVREEGVRLGATACD